MKSNGTAAARTRADIQALRGFAVLAVLLQHIHPGLVHAGWLGVDVFFVVSGFLIAGLVARDIDAGVFSFRAFYLRRAQRLLPAAFATFACTAIAAVFFLDAREWNDFAAQLAGAVTWTANFVLWQQTGYFEGAAQLKPLLHVWSLSVEEQFYLLLPALLVFAPKRWRLPGTLLVGAASLALYLAWMRTRPEAAFYLLPSRAWELALGVAAAFVAQDPSVRRIARWCAAPALVALCAVTLVATGLSAPLSALVACVATMCLLLARFESAERFAPVRGLARVGDFSYSLYLVHWPIFALLHNAQAGDPAAVDASPMLLVAATAASLVLGWGLYRAVERPLRHVHIGHPRRAFAIAITASAVLAIAPLAIAARAQDTAVAAGTDYATLRRDNVGFSEQCEFFRAFTPIPACRNSAHPELLVWGDSFAMAVVPGIVASGKVGVVQATKSSCGPFLGIAQYTDDFPRAFAENCLTFNRSVMAWLRTMPSVRVVALSSAFYPYFDAQRHLVRDGAGDVVPSEALALAVLEDTIREIRGTGRRVVIIAPPPSTGFDYTHCLERRARGRTLFAGRGDCSMDEAQYRASKAGVLDFLRRLEREAAVPVVDFDALLCRDGRCATELHGTAVYRDEGHLSYAGARMVGVQMDLSTRLMTQAR